jgi:hypothetical protein
MRHVPIEDLETAIITKTGHGFEISDSFGEIIGSYKDWRQVEDMFRGNDFSEEYIAKRKADIDRQTTTRISEVNE